MSRMHPGEQVEHAFNSKRLQNWEQPALDKMPEGSMKFTTNTGTRFGTLPARTGKTDFIVDDNGHLKAGVPKLMNSFNHPTTTPVYMASKPRWPQENPTIPAYSKATMGYKGIQTDYLPTSTVSLRAAEVPGTKERNYNFS